MPVRRNREGDHVVASGRLPEEMRPLVPPTGASLCATTPITQPEQDHHDHHSHDQPQQYQQLHPSSTAFGSRPLPGGTALAGCLAGVWPGLSCNSDPAQLPAACELEPEEGGQCHLLNVSHRVPHPMPLVAQLCPSPQLQRGIAMRHVGDRMTCTSHGRCTLPSRRDSALSRPLEVAVVSMQALPSSNLCVTEQGTRHPCAHFSPGVVGARRRAGWPPRVPRRRQTREGRGPATPSTPGLSSSAIGAFSEPVPIEGPSRGAQRLGTPGPLVFVPGRREG